MIVFAILTVIHVSIFLYLTYAWESIHIFKNQEHSSRRVTVIVPVRNESGNIRNVLRDLAKQSYDKSCFDFIIVDDDSDDDTRQIAEDELSKTNSNGIVLSLEHGSGKKAAVTYALEKATGEIILCTDGDCRLPPNWISTYTSFFDKYNPKMVSGPVKMDSKSWFTQYQALDFTSLIGFGAATLTKGMASTCNGANMAYLREVFFEVGGYNGNLNVPSGDDEFLLLKVFRKYPSDVHFIKSPEVIVTTQPKTSLLAFIQQRIRWSTKWRFHYNLWLRLMAVFTFFDFMSLFLLVFLMLSGKFPWLLGLGILGIRWLSECFYLHKAASFLELKTGRFFYPVVSLFYPFFLLFLGFASIFGYYSWKGRKYG